MALPLFPRESYDIGIICSLPLERAAVEATLDEEHGQVKTSVGDNNVYSFGKIGGHNIVIASLPARRVGALSTSRVAVDMVRSFSIKGALLVGIGGGVWSEETDIRLGDVVVGLPHNVHGGVVQWDFGRMGDDRSFRRTGSLNKPPWLLLTAMSSLRARHETRHHKIGRYVEEMLAKYPSMRDKFGYQGREHDQLFDASYDHAGGLDCEECDQSRIIHRPPRFKDFEPRVYYGTIASSYEKVRDGRTRDSLASEMGVLCFESEAAGLMDSYPGIVIRGICDYADSHKNKRWQPYAAATAACYAKELLEVIHRGALDQLGSLQEELGSLKKKLGSMNEELGSMKEEWESASPLKYHLPFSLGSVPVIDCFIDRPEEMGQLVAFFQPASGSARRRTFVLQGPEGIGKTQLCVDYVRKHRGQFSTVFWLDGSSRNALRQSLAQAALRIPQSHETTATRSQEAEATQESIDRLLEWLSISANTRWLLVLDDVGSDWLGWTKNEQIYNFNHFLPSADHGNILMTTKLPDLKIPLTTLHLHAVNNDVGKEILQTHVGKQLVGIEKLVEKLEGLPSALVEAGAFLRRSGSTVDEYMSVYFSNRPAQTDSGYSSMGPRDMKPSTFANDDSFDRLTIVSDDATVFLQEDAKIEAVDAFVDDLHEELLACNVLPSYSLEAKEDLDAALRSFASTLEDAAKPGIETEAARFLKQQRSRISSNLLARFKAAPLSSPPSPSLEPDGTMMSVQDKMHMWNLVGAETDDSDPVNAPEEISDADSVSENEEQNLKRNPYVSSTRIFVTQSYAYRWLIDRLSAIFRLSMAEDSSSPYISDILKELVATQRQSSRAPQITFKLRWQPLEFLEEQFSLGKRQRLGDVITLTSFDGLVQAATCTEYLTQTWPASGPSTLAAVQDAIDQGHAAYQEYNISGGQLVVKDIADDLVITVRGSELTIVEIGTQLCWLGAACRSSQGDQITKVHSEVSKVITKSESSNIDHTTVRFTFVESDIALGQIADDRCWNLLFRNPVIADGFPVLARREHQPGLELSLSMMMTLADADRVTIFDGQTMIKGYSSLLVPTMRLDSSIIWHFSANVDCTRISFAAALQNLGHLEQVDLSMIGSARHFVGWVSSAHVMTGTPGVQYDAIRYPKAPFVGSGCALQSVDISVGKIVGGGATITKGKKDVGPFISHGGSYRQIINDFTKVYVVLFDDDERRGWLVTGTQAILHLLRAQLSSPPISDSSLLNINAFVQANIDDIHCSAKKTLLNKDNYNLPWDEEEEFRVELTSTAALPKREEKVFTRMWTIKDLVIQLCHTMEQILDHQVKIKSATGIDVSASIREKLEGWSFKDIVEREKVLRPRVVTLSNCGRSWVDFTRSIRAVTLIGRGFGDLILPSPSAQPCIHWRTVPQGKDYLTAKARVLREICEKSAGDEDANPFLLAHDTHWHQAHLLYEPCNCANSRVSKRCERTQTLLTRTSVKRPFQSKRRPKPFAHLEGAVIFGASNMFKHWWPGTGDAWSGEGIDDDVESRDSGLGQSLQSQEVSQVSSSDS